MVVIQDAAASSHGNSLLHSLQPNRVLPACMKLQALSQDFGSLPADGMDAVPVLQVRASQTVLSSSLDSA